MRKISIVFHCWRRWEYTKKTLESISENFSEDYEYEFVLLYDEFDEDYYEKLNNIFSFDKEIINYERVLNPAEMMNFAFSQCTGDYFSYWQNDWTIEEDDFFEKSINGIEEKNFEFIRFLRNPYSDDEYFSDEYQFNDYKILEYADEKPNYQYCLNPHLRKEKFPFGKFEYNGWLERDSVELRKERKPDWKAGCLEKDHVRHIGKKSSFKMDGGRM